MKNEIRQAHQLSPELEDKTFELQAEAFELLEDNKTKEAEATIKEAWNLLPEPKFNTSCSDTILCDLIEVLTRIGKYEEAKPILADWINDIETCGYKIYETTPFILSGENFLYLNRIEDAKEQFYKAVKYGATKRDFSDKPTFYFDIAKKKLTDDNEIKTLFENEVRNQTKQKETIQELSNEICDKIEELSEQGNEYIDEENYTEAIKVWTQALSLIPKPQNVYAESQWLETSIGDAYFLSQNFVKALEHFQNAKNNIEENAYENPFIMLRLGQTLFENQQTEEAKEYLLRAYMFEGEEIFENDDEKYFDFLKQNVELK
jgi:tetratricopeptide (TPR) repeat protein